MNRAIHPQRPVVEPLPASPLDSSQTGWAPPPAGAQQNRARRQDSHDAFAQNPASSSPYSHRTGSGRQPSPLTGWRGVVAFVGLGTLLGLISLILPFASSVVDDSDIDTSERSAEFLGRAQRSFWDWLSEALTTSLILLVLSGLCLTIPWLRGRLRLYLSAALSAVPLVTAAFGAFTAGRLFISVRQAQFDESGTRFLMGFWLFLLSCSLLTIGGIWAAMRSRAEWKERSGQPASPNSLTPGRRKTILTILALAVALAVVACVVPYVSVQDRDKTGDSELFPLLQWESAAFAKATLAVVLAVVCMPFLRTHPGKRPGPFVAWSAIVPFLSGIVLLSMSLEQCIHIPTENADASDTHISGSLGLWSLAFASLLFILGGALALRYTLPQTPQRTAGGADLRRSPSQAVEITPNVPDASKAPRLTASRWTLGCLTVLVPILGFLSLCLPYVTYDTGKRNYLLSTLSNRSVAIMLLSLVLSGASLVGTTVKLGTASRRLAALGLVPTVCGTVIAADFLHDLDNIGDYEGSLNEGYAEAFLTLSQRSAGTWCYILCALLLICSGFLAIFLAIRLGSADTRAPRETDSSAEEAAPSLPTTADLMLVALTGIGILLTVACLFVPIYSLTAEGQTLRSLKAIENAPLLFTEICACTLLAAASLVLRGRRLSFLGGSLTLAGAIILFSRWMGEIQNVGRRRRGISEDRSELLPNAEFDPGIWFLGAGALLLAIVGFARIVRSTYRFEVCQPVWPSPLSSGKRLLLKILIGLGGVLAIASCFLPFVTYGASDSWGGERQQVFFYRANLLLPLLLFGILCFVSLGLLRDRLTWLRRRLLVALAVVPLVTAMHILLNAAQEAMWKAETLYGRGRNTTGGMEIELEVGFWLFVVCGLVLLVAGILATVFVDRIGEGRFPPEIPYAHTSPDPHLRRPGPHSPQDAFSADDEAHARPVTSPAGTAENTGAAPAASNEDHSRFAPRASASDDREQHRDR